MTETQEVNLSKEDLLKIYEWLVYTRAYQEALIVNRGKIPGPILTDLGQEACIIGICYALVRCGILESSLIAPFYRDFFGTVIAKDRVAGNDILAADSYRNFLGRTIDRTSKSEEGRGGATGGRDGNVHTGWPERGIVPFACSDLGQSVALLVGAAEAMRRRVWSGIADTLLRPVAVAMFGEGAAAQGIIHESMTWTAASNFIRSPEEIAALKDGWIDMIAKDTRVINGAPVIFVLKDNDIACFTDAGDEHGKSHFTRRAEGYGQNMVGIDVDGTNPEAVFTAAFTAIRRAQDLKPTLLVMHCARLTVGHNEDQGERVYSREELRVNRQFFEVKEVYGLDEAGLQKFREAVGQDPVTGHWRATLLERRVATAGELDAMLGSARVWADGLFEKVCAEPKATPEDDAKDRTVFPPFMYRSPVQETPPKETGKTALAYGKAYMKILGTLLAENPRVTYCGEDVARHGGVLGLTPGLAEEFGPARMRNSSLAESALVGTAAGEGLLKEKPIREFQFSGFLVAGFHTLCRVIAPGWFMHRFVFDTVFVAPCGIVGQDGGGGYFHEDWPERFLVSTRGLVVIAPADAYEVVGLMRAASEYAGPVVVLYQTAAGRAIDFYAEVPEEPFVIPLGKAHIAHEGADVTVVVYGAACVAAAKNEAERLAKEGILLEVINLRTVYPWDTETIRRSVRKTGRCIIMHEDAKDRGLGEQLLGALSKERGFFRYMKTEEVPVLGAATPYNPTAEALVKDRLPFAWETDEKGLMRCRSPKLAALARNLMRYN